jgi:hypothetical protein
MAQEQQISKPLVKDLKDGDLVYVVYKDPDTVVECSIQIEFGDDWFSPLGYYTKRFHGCVYSGKNKMTKDYFADFQVFRIGTAGIWDEDIAEKNGITYKNIRDRYPDIPGGIPVDEYNKQLESTRFDVRSNFIVFTNLEDAKEYIVEQKVKLLKSDLLKLIKVKKYKKK